MDCNTTYSGQEMATQLELGMISQLSVEKRNTSLAIARCVPAIGNMTYRRKQMQSRQGTYGQHSR